MDEWSSSLCDPLALAVRDPRGWKDEGWMSHIAPWCEQKQPGGLEPDGTEVGAAGKRGAGGNRDASTGEKMETAVRPGCSSLSHGQQHAPQRPRVTAGSVMGHTPVLGRGTSPARRPLMAVIQGCCGPCRPQPLGWLPHCSILGVRSHTSKCFVLARVLRGSPDAYLPGAGQLCSGER